MSFSKPFANGMLFSAGMLATAIFAGVALAAWNSTMSGATPGSALTASGWNAVIDNITDLNTRLTNLSGKNVGSTFTYWGAGTAPANTTLLYSGWGFGGHYSQSNNTAPVCIQGWDAGGASANAASAYGALYYPMGTGDATRMPPGVVASTHVRCSKVSVAGPTFEAFGTNSCPSGWSVLYSGYAMGGYYGHTGDINSAICVDASNYDSSKSWTWTSGGTYLSAAYIAATSDATNYPINRYMKCAVCGKY